MIEPQRSIVIDQVVVSFDVVVSFVEAVEGVGSFAWGDVEVVVAPVMVRGGVSSSSVALRSSLRRARPSLLRGGPACGDGVGGVGFRTVWIALAAAAVSFSLDFWGDRWDEGAGEVGVGELRGLVMGESGRR